MDFRAGDIFALIHPHGTPFFDVSFVRAEGLELFWSRYELAKMAPEWRDFSVQAISRQNNIKKVTVLTCNKSLSCIDIMTWIGRYGEVVSIPQKNRDEFGIWSGAWTFMVKLKVSETPRMGRGLWKLNSSLLEVKEIRRSFEDFLQSQETCAT
ncbi:zinc finger CCHC domain-containing protein 3-like [Hyla sarda]|uniref:zinc finger CCHC domain-containing protein 3-like n=1 Tax=Hyla sarda TaxID=327740 RepID=UPI0024C4320D|nr:zinc finger CCHC domain-containing protein 3-like [Hyla sarda]